MADLRPVYVAGDGDVKGPASSSNNFLPLFADTTGKLLKSSGTGVTTQGLAILDDNTPAEQRNTIGLDQVNNTSDINKPVSTSQQYALNLKQDKLLYTPVQQGGGIGQSANKVYLGWSSAAKLKVTVDSTDLGNVAFNLDSVNNTSDANKPVSTAQQAALNLKMNLTGDGAVPRLGGVSVNSARMGPNQQGVYLLWNETGEGKTSLVNNQGEGIGGFTFRNVNKDNTAETGRVIIDRGGSLTTSGSITSATNIYGANGAVIVATDGNVSGSIWGGWLSEYITNKVTGAIATTLGYNQTWQNVTANRALATTYTNTTGRPIQVFVDFRDSGASVLVKFNINGISWDSGDLPDANRDIILWSFVIPAGGSYSLSGGVSIRRWLELR